MLREETDDLVWLSRGGSGAVAVAERGGSWWMKGEGANEVSAEGFTAGAVAVLGGCGKR